MVLVWVMDDDGGRSKWMCQLRTCDNKKKRKKEKSKTFTRWHNCVEVVL
jgi:predicted RNA-binding protein YlxR (DUF448 family)